MTKVTLIKKLYELSEWILDIASRLEKGNISIKDVPKCYMDIIDPKNARTLTLPKNNMISTKFHRNNSRTRQLCVIPNTEENRKALRHINKLAKEQNSYLNLKYRYRVPKEGNKYGSHGELRQSNADGIGIYINNELTDETYPKLYSEIRRLESQKQTLESRCKNLDTKRAVLITELVTLKERIQHTISNII
jgi:hypothetical protein